MANDKDLTSVEAHFAFGDNWAEYARDVSQEHVDEAIAGLVRLLGSTDLSGKRWLDIGSGSGIHSLAALKLGASEVLALDLDSMSVETTRRLLQTHAADSAYRVEAISVFDLHPDVMGTFDIVYSWGVLHHTGDMYRAIRQAAAMVAPCGDLVIALYHETWLCPLWTAEKRWYSQASSRNQAFARSLYIAIAALRCWMKGRRFKTFLMEYRQNRGMDYVRDVHDWLGGYPYESLLPNDLEATLTPLGFTKRESFVRDWFGAKMGLFGTGCDEYVYQRNDINDATADTNRDDATDQRLDFGRARNA